MRFLPHRGPEEEPTLPPGSILLAHPSMLDPNFKHGVVLLTAHSESDGALGVVVNRPLGQTLGEYDPGLSQSDFGDVPLYAGGPVAADQMILVAWKWAPEDGTFKLYFGIDEAKARQLLDDDPEFQLRGFLGHSGWSEGQLEAELDQGAWVLARLAPDIDELVGEEVWRSILRRVSPEMHLFADEPDDPTLN